MLDILYTVGWITICKTVVSSCLGLVGGLVGFMQFVMITAQCYE